MATPAAAIQAQFGADTGPLSKDTATAESIIGKFSANTLASLSAVGISLSAGALMGFFKSVIDKAGALQDISDRLDVSTDALQGFGHAISLAGGSTEDAAKILQTAKLKLDELAVGNEAAEKSFAALRLTAGDFKGLSLEQSIEKIAAALVKFKDDAGAASAANDILGKSGTKLTAIIQQLGSEGFQSLTDSAREAGQVIEGETIAKLDELGDNMAKLKGAATTLGATVLGAFNSFAQGLGYAAAHVVNTVTGVSTAWDAQESSAKRAEQATTVLTQALRGTAATAQEIARAANADAKAEDERTLAKLDSLQKIEFYQNRIIDLYVRRSKFDANTKEALELQARITETISKLEKERAGAVESLKKAEEERAKRSKLQTEQELELYNLERKGVANLMGAERARYEQLKLIGAQKSNMVKIEELLEKGVKNLTVEERAKLNALIDQTKEIEKQIARREGIVKGTEQSVTALKPVTEELNTQVKVLDRMRLTQQEINKLWEAGQFSKLNVKRGREDSDLSDRELAEKIQNLRDGLTASQLSDPTGKYAYLDNLTRQQLESAEWESSRRREFRSAYAREGEKAFLRYSAFDEQTLRNYIRPEDEKRAQQQAEDIRDMRTTLRRIVGQD